MNYESVIKIRNYKQFNKIGRNKNYPIDGVYSIEKNIDFGGNELKSIGTPENPFCGIINGNGNKIVNYTEPSNCALFHFTSKPTYYPVCITGVKFYKNMKLRKQPLSERVANIIRRLLFIRPTN